MANIVSIVKHFRSLHVRYVGDVVHHLTDIEFRCKKCKMDICVLRDIETISTGGVINHISVTCPKCGNTIRENANISTKHPVIGELTEEEVSRIKWTREVEAEWKAEECARKEKLNKIIDSVIEKLEKFRDEEL